MITALVSAQRSAGNARFQQNTITLKFMAFLLLKVAILAVSVVYVLEQSYSSIRHHECTTRCDSDPMCSILIHYCLSLLP
jgi:hypothetical protein